MIQQQCEEFTEACLEWDIERLVKDLEGFEKRPLTSKEKRNLQAILLGLSASQARRRLGVPQRKRGLDGYFTKIRRIVEFFSGLDSNTLRTSHDVVNALASYRKGKEPPLPKLEFDLLGRDSDPITQVNKLILSEIKVFEVPLRDQLFTGRDELISTLRQDFILTTPLRRKQVLSAAGGYGKTQIAIEYTYRYKDDYKIIYWIRSETLSNIALDYANLATQLNLSEQKSDDQQIKINAVKRFLANNADWLLIFDNAEDPTYLRDFIPRNDSGHILITSQKRSVWTGIAHVQEVLTFLLNESVDLLLSNISYKDRKLAEELAKELGNLPLAVSQASAYIFKTGCSIQFYLELFKKHSRILLAKHIEHSEYPYTVATTWQISLQRIKSISPLAITLLNVCAFLAPENIPINLFLVDENYENKLQTIENTELTSCPIVLRDAIAALNEYSLIKSGHEYFSIHRLVQLVVKEQMRDEKYLEIAINLISRVMKFDYFDKISWLICQMYFSHSITVIDHAKKFSIANLGIVNIQSHLGRFMVCIARGNEAIQYLLESIENARKLLSNILICDDHIEEVKDLQWHSNEYTCEVLAMQGKREEAVKCRREMLDLSITWYGSSHEKTDSARKCLGCTYIQNDQLDIGEQLVSEIFNSKDFSLHDEEAVYLTLLLGIIATKKKKWGKALKLYQSSEKDFIFAREKDENHHTLGIIYYHMMIAYDAIGDSANSTIMFHKARNSLVDSPLEYDCTVDMKELRKRLSLEH